MADDPMLRPYQDPTALTTAQLQRELLSLEKLFGEQLHSLVTRVDAMEKAQTLFHDDLVRVPTAVDKAVGQLKELHEKWFIEKFASIERQIAERDDWGKQVTLMAKEMVATAMQAQERLVTEQNTLTAQASAKAEENFMRSITQQGDLLKTTANAHNDKIDDLKERLTLIEGRTAGITTATTAQHSAQSLQYGAAGVQQGAQHALWSIIALGIGTALSLVNLALLLRH